MVYFDDNSNSMSSVECKCGQIKTLQRQTFKVRWWIQSSSSFDMNNYMWPNFFFDKVKLFIKRVFCTMVKRVIITQDFLQDSLADKIFIF